VVVGGVGEATNATGLPTAARRRTQRFGDLTFGISLVSGLSAKEGEVPLFGLRNIKI
jgi:hypothetical protein